VEHPENCTNVKGKPWGKGSPASIKNLLRIKKDIRNKTINKIIFPIVGLKNSL